MTNQNLPLFNRLIVFKAKFQEFSKVFPTSTNGREETFWKFLVNKDKKTFQEIYATRTRDFSKSCNSFSIDVFTKVKNVYREGIESFIKFLVLFA